MRTERRVGRASASPIPHPSSLISNHSSPAPRPTPRAPRAFTLIEALAVITLASIAGAALLLGTTTSLDSTDEAMRRTIAYGMAQQLMDEVVGCRYMCLGGDPYQIPFCPNAAEASGPRAYYDDIDDFEGLRFQPPADPYGIALGTDDGQGGQRKENFRCRSDFFQYWRQEIDITYVAENNLTTKLPSGQTSDYRAVEVRIIFNDPNTGPRELAKLRRVLAYVAPLQIN